MKRFGHRHLCVGFLSKQDRVCSQNICTSLPTLVYTIWNNYQSYSYWKSYQITVKIPTIWTARPPPYCLLSARLASMKAALWLADGAHLRVRFNATLNCPTPSLVFFSPRPENQSRVIIRILAKLNACAEKLYPVRRTFGCFGDHNWLYFHGSSWKYSGASYIRW